MRLHMRRVWFIVSQKGCVEPAWNLTLEKTCCRCKAWHAMVTIQCVLTARPKVLPGHVQCVLTARPSVTWSCPVCTARLKELPGHVQYVLIARLKVLPGHVQCIDCQTKSVTWSCPVCTDCQTAGGAGS